MITVEKVDKRTWRTYVQSPRYPHNLRWLRGTLVMLLPLVAKDGTLAAGRAAMCSTTGLSERTIGYHLTQAVEHGLLVRTMPGGWRHNAVYSVSVPASVAA